MRSKPGISDLHVCHVEAALLLEDSKYLVLQVEDNGLVFLAHNNFTAFGHL